MAQCSAHWFTLRFVSKTSNQRIFQLILPGQLCSSPQHERTPAISAVRPEGSAASPVLLRPLASLPVPESHVPGLTGNTWNNPTYTLIQHKNKEHKQGQAVCLIHLHTFHLEICWKPPQICSQSRGDDWSCVNAWKGRLPDTEVC